MIEWLLRKNSLGPEAVSVANRCWTVSPSDLRPKAAASIPEQSVPSVIGWQYLVGARLADALVTHAPVRTLTEPLALGGSLRHFLSVCTGVVEALALLALTILAAAVGAAPDAWGSGDADAEASAGPQGAGTLGAQDVAQPWASTGPPGGATLAEKGEG